MTPKHAVQHVGPFFHSHHYNNPEVDTTAAEDLFRYEAGDGYLVGGERRRHTGAPRAPDSD
jgi:hypothetical protein